MTIGERLKEIRTKKGISVDALAEMIGISRATIFRYENGSIKKIPIGIMESISAALGISPYELMSDEVPTTMLPADTYDSAEFNDPQKAMAFLLKLPSIAAYGGYDLTAMDDDTLLAFANEVLHQIETVSYKFR